MLHTVSDLAAVGSSIEHHRVRVQQAGVTQDDSQGQYVPHLTSLLLMNVNSSRCQQTDNVTNNTGVIAIDMLRYNADSVISILDMYHPGVTLV